MADDDQEKTEQPTGKRLQQAKDKGQVPRSKEAGTATVLLAGILGLLMLQTPLSEAVMNVFIRCFNFERREVFDPNTMYGFYRHQCWRSVMAVGRFIFYRHGCQHNW
jgi:Flagellar biosynthesis pathway, component FlhB